MEPSRKGLVMSFLTLGSLRGLVPSSWRDYLAAWKRRFLFFGMKYRCSFCHAWLSRLVPFGVDTEVLRQMQVVGGGRRPCRCAVCGSSDRQRLTLQFIKHRTDLLGGSKPRVLHFAAEPVLERVLRRALSPNYLTADLDNPTADVHFDIQSIPFEASSFDAILCSHVLEHVPDDHLALRELFRVLKPGGWAILQVPISYLLPETLEDPNVSTKAERLRRFGQEDHVRLYGSDYPSRIRSAGFLVEEFRWNDENNRTRFGGAMNRYGLNPDEVLYLGRKPTQADLQTAR